MTRKNQDLELPSPPLPTQEQAKQANALEKARDDLHFALNQYRALLKDTTLPENKGKKEQDAQMQVFSDINKYTPVLEMHNSGEGFMALCITTLNSVLKIKDELNSLRFQNYMLHNKLLKLSEPIQTSETPPASEPVK